MAYVYIYYDPRKEPIEPIYVGKGNDDRITDHLYKSSNNILESKIKKIREAGLEPIFEKYIDNISEEDAYLIEIELVKKFGKIYNNTGTLCNYADGGKGGRLGFEHSEETKKLFSEQRKGKKQTEKQYEANCKRVCSEETKEKIRNKLKGRKRTEESIEKSRQWHLGSKRSEETKKLFSEQRKGKKQTEEHILNAKKARKESYKRKKVKCMNNDKIYENVTDASNDLQLKETAIVAVANGSRKQHKGYQFIYILED
jgi:hypothetical protein